jgi:septal ring factor EnvC (AmiA/AmiB activator)
MGKAIAAVSLILLMSIGFVLLQLWRHAPRGAEAAPASGSAPVLEVQSDGSVYSIGLKLDRFERRLMEEEQRSRQLTEELSALRQEREGAQAQIGELQTEIRRLRRQLEESSRPEPAAPPANAPPANAPSAVPTPPPFEGTP